MKITQDLMHPGYSTGDAIRAVQEVADGALNQNYEVEFTGLSREELALALKRC